MKTYHRQLLAKLEDRNLWPRIERPEFIQALHDFANAAHARRTTEGYLAALLVYHQLVEEMTKVLIDCSTFLLQCRVFPEEFNGRRPDRQRMFGQLLAELEAGVVNDDTHRFIEKCRSLNTLRIRIVHKITLKTDFRDIRRQASQTRKLFDDIWSIYDTSYDSYRDAFGDHRKDLDDLAELANEL